MSIKKPFTDKQFALIDAELKRYDEARKAEGYRIIYRRVAWYSPIPFAWESPKVSEPHIETLFISNDPEKPSLLVKVMAGGQISGWEPAK